MRYYLSVIFCLFITVVAYAQEGPHITYRLESDVYLISPDHGDLYILPEILDEETEWTERYVQELRLLLRGKPSHRTGYRIEPRFQITYQHDSTEAFDWVLDQGYGYVDFSDRVTLFLGKQRIRWGTGMTYTPTDRLQPVPNTLDPTRYLEGIAAARLEMSLPVFSVSALYSPDRNLGVESSGNGRLIGLRLFKLVGTTDLYLSATHDFESEVNAGGAFAWDSGPAVIYGECAFLKQSGGTLRHYLGKETETVWKPQVMLGASRVFSASTSVYIEGYYTGWGLNRTEYDDFLDRLQSNVERLRQGLLDPFAALDYAALYSLAQPTIALRQWYAAANGTYTYHDAWSVSGNAVVEPVGGTLYLYPLVSYIGFQNVDLTAGISLTAGSSKGERDLLPAWYAVDGRFILYF